MSDLIDRQAAIDALGEVHPLDYNAIAVRNRIRALPSAQPEPQWIPITDKLPDLDEYVLATTSWGAITIAERWKDTNGEENWFVSEGECNAERDDIVAWKPLPEPYKGETDG